MEVKEIEIKVKKNVYGYFEEYCNNCVHADMEISKTEPVKGYVNDEDELEFKVMYECRNKELCKHLYEYLKLKSNFEGIFNDKT